jgi:hypothetical protein
VDEPLMSSSFPLLTLAIVKYPPSAEVSSHCWSLPPSAEYWATCAPSLVDPLSTPRSLPLCTDTSV